MLTPGQSAAVATVYAQAYGYYARSRRVCGLLVMSATCFLSGCSKNKKFGFGLGDRIAIVGNSLAERMQHDGWLESYIQAVHPDHRLPANAGHHEGPAAVKVFALRQPHQCNNYHYN